MRTRLIAAKVAVLLVGAAPLMTGVAHAGGKSVAEYVHSTMSNQVERGCTWGQEVSRAGADNRQDSAWHRPGPCK
jgi:hypothetical protein